LGHFSNHQDELVNQSPGLLSRRGLLAGLGGAALLAGCGFDKNGNGVEVPEVRLGVLAVPDTAPLYVAQRQGIFQRDGLRPRMVPSELTGDNRFDLENGPEDIHFDSWVTIFLNIADGADWVLVGEAYQMSTNTTALLTGPRSKLRSARDLKGTRIAVNNPRGLGVMLISSLLATVGLTTADVEFVETPFDKIGAALRSGDAESGWLVEPYLTLAQLENGAVPLADTAAGPTQELPQSGYVCARSFAQKNPGTIKAFQAALVDAQVRSLDRTVIERELRDYLAVTDTVASLMNVGTFPSSLRAVRPQRVADLMTAQGMLARPMDVSKLVLA
jgi:NitT/TauT family transport system substrate-binding protein